MTCSRHHNLFTFPKNHWSIPNLQRLLLLFCSYCRLQLQRYIALLFLYYWSCCLACVALLTLLCLCCFATTYSSLWLVIAAGVSCVCLCNRYMAFWYVWKLQPGFALYYYYSVVLRNWFINCFNLYLEFLLLYLLPHNAQQHSLIEIYSKYN